VTHPPFSLDAAESRGSFVEVLVDCPGTEKLFTYRLPHALTIQVGDILSVPFGPQTVGGIAIRCFSDLPETLPTDQIREVVDRVSSSLFPAHYWSLLERVAQYYYAPLMAVIRVALPPGLLMRSQRRIRLTPLGLTPAHNLTPAAQKLLTVLQQSPHQDYTWTYLQRQVKGANLGLRELRQRGYIESYVQAQAHAQPKRQQVVTLLSSALPDLTPRQQEILAILKQQGGEMWLQPFVELCHTTPKTLKTLAEKGYVAITLQERLRLEHSPFQSDQAQTLTPDQEQVLAIIENLQGFHQVLLHGVTGSGKTEVYLQAIAPILKQGRSALVLVPEIGLTPQLTDRFRARFGDRVRVYHSALSDGERYDTWRQLLTETAQVVIGTRSAVFSPLSNLGMIILDEEHDTGYKQDRPTPCYHARTVARWRAAAENCPLILGSATPSLESWATSQHLLPNIKSAQPNSHHYLCLPQRVHARPMPPISIVDMRQELEQGNRTLFSRKLQAGLNQLHSGQQGLLFIHRRGHSTFVSCRSCGYVVECPHCSVSLTYHHSVEIKQPVLRCHYCNFTQVQPSQCPNCSSPYFRFFGSGTQRVIEDLNRQFPNLRVLRFDSDTTRRKGAHRELLDRFAAGEANLMVGTQMLTKGIDLPQVQFVGVLAADSLLNLPDFRASERTFQTLLQVAGRAGRGEQPGQVIMQTYNPDHPVIQAVQRYAYETTVASELQQREALQYPPYGQLIVLRLSSLNEQQVETTAQSIATYLAAKIEALNLGVAILGPAPANILRVARRYRWQVLLKLPPTVDDLPAWTLPVSDLRAQCPKDVRLTIDVDPLTLL
jgi:primosomal protein N' (replication factor Y) (superfamily II helicase)